MHLVDTIARLAPSRVTVLLLGGSPDEQLRVATALHDASPRRLDPFVVLECSEDVAEALEPYLRGPVSQRGRKTLPPRGSGTLYLAAIERLPLLLQPRLMTFLDEDARPRVVVSTHAELAAEVREGRFRSDLAGRLLLVQLVVT
jgi:DNA-binding NtrC family response regulator